MSIESKGSKFLARWEANHPDEPPKRKPISKSFETKRAAEMYLSNVAPKENQWDLYRPLNEAMTAWIAFRRDSGFINEKTAERQFGIADNFGRTLPKKTVSQVSTENVQSALSAMARRPAPSSAGRNARPSAEASYPTSAPHRSWAVLRGKDLRRTPEDQPGRGHLSAAHADRGPEGTNAAAGRRLSRLTRRQGSREREHDRSRDAARVTGMRRGEGLALERDDFDLGRRIVRITKSLLQTKKGGLKLKRPKSEKGTRDVEVPAWFFPMLTAHYARLDAQKALLGDAYVDRWLVFPDAFGGYLKPDTVSGQVAEIKRRAGWPEGVAGLHGLRHKFASYLAHSGQVSVKDIAHALGHADEAFTLRVYVRRKPEAPQTAHLFFQRGISPGTSCREASAGSD